ncbi:MAG: cation diffusion facilitator family transporter [Candidatus Kariarchaeaceae archaeon]|jgi:cation diffusion facilitator family transporter
MAGASLKAALTVNFLIGVIKTVVGLFTGSAAMISEAYHSFADTFNQILLALGIQRSGKEPDLEHPFGYKKVQFFWAFVVAILIFGVSGTLAMIEGFEILRHPEEHTFKPELFIWQILVLLVAIVLEAFALKTAVDEARVYQEETGNESLIEAVDEMQDPVLLSLLVEDSLALAGLVIALIGSVITYITSDPIVDGYTSIAIGVVLMTGGLLLARENKTYLVGKAVSSRIQSQIVEVLDASGAVKTVNSMKTLLIGPKDMILALDITFSKEALADKTGAADDIDTLEKQLSEAVEFLTPDRIFIESQVDTETE